MNIMANQTHLLLKVFRRIARFFSPKNMFKESKQANTSSIGTEQKQIRE